MGIFRKKGAGVLPVPKTEMDAAYIMGEAFNEPWECCGRDRSMLDVFQNSILRILFSNFEYTGMSKTEANAIERHLIMKGRVVAARGSGDIVTGEPAGVFFGRLSVENAPDGGIDFYGQPRNVRCTGLNGTSIRGYDGQYVIGYDTCAWFNIQTQIPPIYALCMEFAKRIYNAWSAWQVAVQTSKVGTIINVPDNRTARLVQNVLNRVGVNNPYIVLQNAMDGISNVSAEFRTSAENVKTFYDNYVNTWGSLLDMLGAPNSAPNKHERLLTNELEMNQSLARYISGDRLKARRDFISEVNKKFGTNYRVDNYLEMLITEESNYGMESDDIDNDVQPMGGNAGRESVERPRG